MTCCSRLSSNSNNYSSVTARPVHKPPTGSSCVNAASAATPMHNAAHVHHQPLPPWWSPAAAARQDVAARPLPRPLVPHLHKHLPQSTARTNAHFVTTKPLVAAKPVIAAPVSIAYSNQLPVPIRYAVPACSQLRFSPRQSVGMVQNGPLPNNTNARLQSPTPVGMCPQRNCSSVPRAFISHAAVGTVPPQVNISTGSNNVPLAPFSSVAALSSVQSGIIDSVSSPLVSLDACASLSGLTLSDDDFSLLQDAMKEEFIALGFDQLSISDQFTGCSVVTSVHCPVESSSVESDSSLSDWSVIDLPSPSASSSVTSTATGHKVVPEETSGMAISDTKASTSSLMQFSPDVASSHSVCAGSSMPRRDGEFPAQKLSVAYITQSGSIGCLYFLHALIACKSSVLFFA